MHDYINAWRECERQTDPFIPKECIGLPVFYHDRQHTFNKFLQRIGANWSGATATLQYRELDYILIDQGYYEPTYFVRIVTQSGKVLAFYTYGVLVDLVDFPETHTVWLSVI
mgnify:CR=1 FL=1